MSLFRMSPENMELLRATASDDYAVAIEAQRALAQALTEPLRKGIFDEDNLGGIYARMVLAPGAQANFQLDFVRPGTEDVDFTALTRP